MSALFMLDTDTVSYALRGHGQVGVRLLAQRPSEVCISVVTLAELRYGASRRKSAKLHRMIDTFTENVVALPFDERCAAAFGRIASDLAARGSPIGELDVMIAAHAVTIEATLVTNNSRHFQRVRGLQTENWV